MLMKTLGYEAFNMLYVAIKCILRDLQRTLGSFTADCESKEDEDD